MTSDAARRIRCAGVAVTLGAGMLLVTGPAAFAAPTAASGQANANGGSGYPGETVTPRDNPAGQAKGDEPGRGAGGAEHDEGCAPGHDSDRPTDDGHGCGHSSARAPECGAHTSHGRSESAHDESKGNGDAKSDSAECPPTPGSPGSGPTHTGTGSVVSGPAGSAPVTSATQPDSAPESGATAVLGMSGQRTATVAPSLAVAAQPASATPAAVIPTVVEGMSGVRTVAPAAVLAAAAGRGSLAFTGSLTVSLIAAAVVLMLLGSIMVLMGRRQSA